MISLLLYPEPASVIAIYSSLSETESPVLQGNSSAEGGFLIFRGKLWKEASLVSR
jgi:hypothetical protein